MVIMLRDKPEVTARLVVEETVGCIMESIVVDIPV